MRSPKELRKSKHCVHVQQRFTAADGEECTVPRRECSQLDIHGSPRRHRLVWWRQAATFDLFFFEVIKNFSCLLVSAVDVLAQQGAFPRWLLLYPPLMATPTSLSRGYSTRFFYIKNWFLSFLEGDLHPWTLVALCPSSGCCSRTLQISRLFNTASRRTPLTLFLADADWKNGGG